MKTAIAVFAYNRNVHLSKVLEALKENERADAFYIFQDGLKCEEHRDGWEKTREVIESIDWCEKKVIYAEHNKGLAKSIVDGVNAVFEENDAIIVLEDDCVPAPAFVSFMKQCFEKYEDEKQVYNISGYKWPIDVEKPENQDIYFCGRTSSWGWGTWKDRWSIYKQDYEVINRLKSNSEGSKRLGMWGMDLEKMLEGRVSNQNNSWAVFWSLLVIEQGGYSIAPYYDLIRNIGHDGTGVHCGNNQAEYNVQLFKDKDIVVNFPKEVAFQDDIIEKFAALYGSYAVTASENEGKEHVLIYGTGNFYRQHEKELVDKYYIKGYVDKYKQGYFCGKRILAPERVKTAKFDKIVIMLADRAECMRVATELIKTYGIENEKICFGGGQFSVVDRFYITPDARFRMVIDDLKIDVVGIDEFNNVCEVFNNKNYQYCLNNGRDDVVFDIGMNIGDSSLYFAKAANIKAVYAYEPFRETYMHAMDNIKLNPMYEQKIKAFNFGLSDINENRKIKYNSNMSCGQSTEEASNSLALATYEGWRIIDVNENRFAEVEVKKASEVMMPIILENKENNIVLKMDCEGEEYAIIEELDKTGILQYIDFIMLEWHYNGSRTIIDCLLKNGFLYWGIDKNANMGMIYACKWFG